MTNRITPLETDPAAAVLTVDKPPIRVACVGLAGAETVKIQHMLDGVPKDSEKTLTATVPAAGIFTPGEYRLEKPSTAGDSALCVDGLSGNAIGVE